MKCTRVNCRRQPRSKPLPGAHVDRVEQPYPRLGAALVYLASGTVVKTDARSHGFHEIAQRGL